MVDGAHTYAAEEALADCLFLLKSYDNASFTEECKHLEERLECMKEPEYNGLEVRSDPPDTDFRDVYARFRNKITGEIKKIHIATGILKEEAVSSAP